MTNFHPTKALTNVPAKLPTQLLTYLQQPSSKLGLAIPLMNMIQSFGGIDGGLKQDFNMDFVMMPMQLLPLLAMFLV